MAGEYSYTALPTQGHIRLLTLKASKSESADLYGELVDYPLQECEGDLHCYEALSYVWGDDKKPRYIWIGAYKLCITESLYTALLRLRNHSADRCLWVDAICIDQTDDDEKSVQVQRMANVYSSASRVRVWLGESDTADGSDKALYCLSEAGAAEGSFELPDNSLESIRNILARDWFNRVWVLQEVAAAQHVVLMCGATSIDGYAFCVGLQALHQSGKIPDLQDHIGSIVYLIRRSIFRLGQRSRQESQESLPKFSLNIQSLGQLIDLYRNRQATDQRDKVYALLGMCSEDVPQDLQPNYSNTMTWDLLLGNLARYVFGTDAHIQIVCTNVAAVRTKGKILGHISSFRPDEHRYDMQKLSITSWNAKMQAFEREWTVPTSAVPVQIGDVVSLLQGGQNIAILRSNTEFLSVVTTSGRWNTRSLQYDGESEKADEHELLLAWDWTSRNEAIPLFINMAFTKSILVQDVDALARREFVANVLISAKSDEIAEPILLDLERELYQRQIGTTSAKLEYSAKIVYIHLRQDRLDEAEKRYTGIYQLAKETLGTEWLSQSISQYLNFFPTAKYTTKAAIWQTLKSGIDKKLDFPQYYVEIHRKLADTFAQGTVEDASLLIDLGEIIPCDGRTSLSLAALQGDSIYTTEDPIEAGKEAVVRAAAGNKKAGREVIELLFERRGDQIQITENVLEAGAGNWDNGREVMELLFEKREDQIQITENVLKAAAKNWGSGGEVLELLFEKRGDQIQITENVLKAAAGNSKSGREVLELLFEKKGDQIQITENVLKAAVENSWSGRKIVELLFEKKRDQIQITENVLKAAVENSWSGRKIVELLFERRGDQIQITENVLKAAAGNSQSAREVLELLFEKRGDQIQITENVLKAAVKNSWSGRKIVELLFERRGDQIQITENVLKAAARNWFEGWEVMGLLFEKRGDQIQITENVLKAAAKNWVSGWEVIELLFEKIASPVLLKGVKSMALNSAAVSGNLKVVKLLLSEKETDCTIPDPDGRTPLINASRNGHTEVVQRLLDCGADWRLVESSGLDALQWAIWNDHHDVEDLLLSVGAVRSDDVYGFHALFQ